MTNPKSDKFSKNWLDISLFRERKQKRLAVMHTFFVLLYYPNIPMPLKKYSILLLLCIISICLKAQENKTLWDARLKMFVYDFVEKPPTFPGGEVALAKYLSKIRYPKEQDDLQGKLNLSFVIDTIGNLLDKCILGKNESAYTLLDKEGIGMLDRMPKWIPGEQNGKKVAVRFFIPMYICLQME
jgi:protein TonB